MSTFMPKSNEIVRNWYVLDAANKPLGRVAAVAADLLRGKRKTIFAPHVDCGDHVIIINSDKAVLTGDKANKKFYRRHTGWVGGLKEVKYSILMKENSDKAMQLAVKGMVPDTTIGRAALTRLHIYKDGQHNHSAQKPQEYTL